MKQPSVICFYLPQFHPTVFNDENWGPGFSEWTNVARGSPRFPEHYQPRIPGELGFYDLRNRDMLRQQITLAQAHGIHGFCFYHYRFGKQTELDLPLNSLLSQPNPQLPFCLCWANESWTRAWDGRSDEVIRAQSYDEDTLSGLVGDLTRAMLDPRYIRVSGRPLFMIYQVEHIPEPRHEWLDNFRKRVRERIGTEMLLGAVFSHGFNADIAKLVDLVVQFPPHRTPRNSKRALIPANEMKPFEPERGDYFESYDAVVEAALGGARLFEKLVPGVCPDWDNASRRQTKAHMLIGSTPEKFSNWVAKAARISLEKAAAGQIPAPLLFVNAWNEWAEGAAIEPSWKHQRAYLGALRQGLEVIEAGHDSAPVVAESQAGKANRDKSRKRASTRRKLSDSSAV